MWWRGRRCVDTVLFGFAHTHNLRRVDVAQLTRRLLQPLLPCHGVQHLHGIFLRLLLDSLLRVNKTSDFLQEFTLLIAD